MDSADWKRHKELENIEFHNARLEQKRYCFNNNVFIFEQGLYETPKSLSSVSINDGTWLRFQTKCKGGKQIHIKNIKKDFRKIIRSYACFLRAVGVDNENAMLFYILDFITYYISFYRGGNIYNWKNNSWEQVEGLKVDFNKTIKLVIEIIKWAIKKDIKDIDTTKFVDTRSRKAPEIPNSANGKISKSVKMKMVKSDENKELYERINTMYNPDLSNEENCKIINVSKPTLIKWKKANATESKEDRINRLYNKNLSWKENEEIIGYSRNTIKKYLKVETDSEEIEHKIIIKMEKEHKFENKIDTSSEHEHHIIIKADEIERDLNSDFSDDWCRTIFGDEYMKELERERERKEKFYSKFEGFDF